MRAKYPLKNLQLFCSRSLGCIYKNIFQVCRVVNCQPFTINRTIMSQKKIRVTGFTRFLLFMMLVVPIAFVCASYYNGEDGLQKAKDLLGIGGEKTEKINSDAPATAENSASTVKLEDCQDRIELLERKLERREQEILDLEDKVKALKKGE